MVAKGKVHRLEDLDVQFVSLVTAGANRQTKFMVVKAQACPVCGTAVKLNDGGFPRCPGCGNLVTAIDVKSPILDGGGTTSKTEPSAGIDLAALIDEAEKLARMALAAKVFQVSGPSEESAVEKDAEEKESAQRVDDGAAPPVEDERDALEKEAKDLKEDVAKLRKELAEARSALTKANAKIATLKCQVVGTTSLPSRNTAVKAAPKPAPMWAGDLAALAVKE
jgi:hypothetical protein